MVKNGDLVEVVYLPKPMYHFSVSVGVVVKKSGKSFFINQVNKKGELIKNSHSGWYSEENVGVLIPGYKRGVLDGAVVYRNVVGLGKILSKAFKRTESLSAKYSRLNKLAWAKFFSSNNKNQ